MAKPEQVIILVNNDVNVWNHWREMHSEIRPNLRRANLSGMNLSSTNFRNADLEKANLREANLSQADFKQANLSGANLSEANLREVDFERANLSGANLSKANLDCTKLSNADLSRANLRETNLKKAWLWHTIFRMADLRRVNLSGVQLGGTNLIGANLRGANLSNSDLEEVNLTGSDLSGADLSEASLVSTNLRNAILKGADLRFAMFASINGNSANLSGATLTNAHFTSILESSLDDSYLHLAAAEGLESADFGNPDFLKSYIAKAFDYAHQPDIPEKEWFPDFFEKALANIKALRSLYSGERLPTQLIEVVHGISAQLISYIATHPRSLHELKPRQFEELIAEILSSYGWQICLTPPTKDGGYDLFAISKDIAGVQTSWIIECKKYKAERKVGVDIVRALYGIKGKLQIANAMLATTSFFTRGVQDFKASCYDLELRDYQDVVEWINEYRPHPDGKLYFKDNQLKLPGDI
ncbi:pentapeptide repeat-containing protein [Planctomycetota bacterium]